MFYFWFCCNEWISWLILLCSLFMVFWWLVDSFLRICSSCILIDCRCIWFLVLIFFMLLLWIWLISVCCVVVICIKVGCGLFCFSWIVNVVIDLDNCVKCWLVVVCDVLDCWNIDCISFIWLINWFRMLFIVLVLFVWLFLVLVKLMCVIDDNYFFSLW